MAQAAINGVAGGLPFEKQKQAELRTMRRRDAVQQQNNFEAANDPHHVEPPFDSLQEQAEFYGDPQINSTHSIGGAQSFAANDPVRTPRSARAGRDRQGSRLGRLTGSPETRQQVGNALRAGSRSAVSGGGAAGATAGAAASLAGQRAALAMTRNRAMQQLQRSNQLRRLQNRKAQLNSEKPIAISQPGDLLYFLAIGFALVGDFFDLAIVGIIPGISFVFTFITTIIIASLIFLAGGSTKRNRARQTFQKYGLLMFSAILEGLGFGLNLLPIETLTIILIFVLVIKERKKQAKVQRRRMARRQKIAAGQERQMSRAERGRAQHVERMLAREQKRLLKQERQFSLAA